MQDNILSLSRSHAVEFEAMQLNFTRTVVEFQQLMARLFAAHSFKLQDSPKHPSPLSESRVLSGVHLCLVLCARAGVGVCVCVYVETLSLRAYKEKKRIAY